MESENKKGWFVKLVFYLVLFIVFISGLLFTQYRKQQRKKNLKTAIFEQVIAKEEPKVDETKWYPNDFFGLRFLTPNKGFDSANQSDLTEKFPGIKYYVFNVLEINSLNFLVSYAETEFLDYNLEIGHINAVDQMISSLGGSNQKLNFKLGESWLPHGYITGTFQISGENLMVISFSHWNDIKKSLTMLVVFGQNSDENKEIMLNSINSIDIYNLKEKTNKLKLWLESDDNFPIKNYDPTDSIDLKIKEEADKELDKAFEEYKKNKVIKNSPKN